MIFDWSLVYCVQSRSRDRFAGAPKPNFWAGSGSGSGSLLSDKRTKSFKTVFTNFGVENLKFYIGHTFAKPNLLLGLRTRE